MKPAFKTWGFWAAVIVAACGFVLQSGAIAEGGTVWQVVGGIATLLGGGVAGAKLKAAPNGVTKFPPEG